MGPKTEQQRIEPFLERLRQLSFVQKVDLVETRSAARRNDFLLKITDRDRRHFQFRGELKTSYFDRPSVNAMIANTRLILRQTEDPLLVLARYIPLPTGERFIEAGVNFLDLVGNMHLVLGSRYERTVVGRVESQKAKEKQHATPAQIQLLLLFATRPEAASWPVRDLGIQAGVSKSKAAEVRNDLIESGLLGHGLSDRLRMSSSTEDLLVSGYARILRPKLVIGRFRPPERELSDFLKRLPEGFEGTRHRCALTGGPAADLLQHFYRGPEAPLFVSDDNAELRQRLRLLPDRSGPITLLRAFGELVFWRKLDSWTVAPPWLVYSELMNADDPRAHEAAAELHHEFLES